MAITEKQYLDADPADVRGAVATNKSEKAFRTISEVASLLDVPPHVLRFWESRFPQIRPVKRRGGRRYYRPEDVTLLQKVKHLLYTQGYTIKGASKLIRKGTSENSEPLPVAKDSGASDGIMQQPLFDETPPSNYKQPASGGTLSRLLGELRNAKQSLDESLN